VALRTLNGFQRRGFQSNAFQMPDVVSGGTGWTLLWLQMARAEERRKKREEERRRKERENEQELAYATLRYKMVPAPVQKPATAVLRLQALTRAKVINEARELDEFYEFMEMIAKADCETEGA